MAKPVIFHIDVNSAFLSWEAHHRLHNLGETLDIRTIPAIIGGDREARHGIVLANPRWQSSAVSRPANPL